MAIATVETISYIPEPIVTMYEPVFATERVDMVTVGRQVFPIVPLNRWCPSDVITDLINVLNGNSPQSESARRSIASDMHNNRDPRKVAVSIPHERAVSAYFTYDPTDEVTEQIIIEWGTIDKTGEAKLHDYLWHVIDYHDRVKQGMRLSSGHLARMQAGFYIALLDQLSATNPTTIQINKKSPLGKMINTLYTHEIVPLTSEGYVQLPVFL